jgi:hypothetical protein
MARLHHGDILKGLYKWTYVGKDKHGYCFQHGKERMWARDDFLVPFIAGGGQVYRPKPKRQLVKELSKVVWLQGKQRLVCLCPSFTANRKQIKEKPKEFVYVLEVHRDFRCSCSCFSFGKLNYGRDLPELSDEQHLCKHLLEFATFLAIEVIAHINTQDA